MVQLRNSIMMNYYLDELACDEKDNSDMSVSSYCKIRTAKIDRPRVNFGKLLFQFIARKKQVTFSLKYNSRKIFTKTK